MGRGHDGQSRDKIYPIWEWLEYVETLGDKLGRSLAQRRRKLLAGFPESFDVVTSPERLKPDPGTYVLPAVYPPHHPKSGQADPNAGRPDLYTLCKAFYPEWHYRIKSGQIKSVPRSSVYEVRELLMTILSVMMMPVMMILIEKPCTRQSGAGRSPVSQYVEYVVGVDTMAE